MSIVNVIGLLAFLGLVLLGLFIMTLQEALHKRPAGRIRSRLGNVTQHKDLAPHHAVQDDLAQAQRDARRRQRRQALGSIGEHLIRIETVSGRRGIVLLAVTLIALALITALIAWLYLPFSLWIKLLISAAVPVLGASILYRHLIQRFQRHFLEQLPDILDMIIRASQAGVPVPQTLRNVGQEFAWPAGPEFRRMGDSLQLGNDMTVVLDDAEQRIEVPDFSFLAVCLLLQRETGGSLSETLSNLAAVVRARRDLRLKTRALTAEGRLSGTIISLIPFCILAFMSYANPEYIAVLFDTDMGRKLLTVAGIMLILGILLIRKIARLET